MKFRGSKLESYLQSKKGLAQKAFVTGAVLAASASANASIAQTDVDAVVAAILATIAIVAAAGVAILTVTLGWDAAFALAKKYIRKAFS